jgi:acylphosphatase
MVRSGSEERLYRVHGRVQGVGFRWWTRALARQLGVTGSVRNLPDGTVEVRARADPQALARLREALGAGPHGASVSAVEEEPTHGVESTGFEIAG